MQVQVHFYSYFREVAGLSCEQVDLPEGTPLADLLATVHQRHPQLAPFHRSTLTAVGVEYQDLSYRLREGDKVSLFPPVQGG